MRFYLIEVAEGGNLNEIYDMRCPPNNSVSETWTTRGLEVDGAQITFLEYEFYDKDPDGVREAFDCMYDSEHTLTIDTSKADAEKLFMYTVNLDGSVLRGFDIDIDKARAVYIFVEPQDFDDERLLNVTEKAENAPASQDAVKNILRCELLGGKDNSVCFALLKCRYVT
ncbi:MAG: hypothetical protein J6A83_08915 [Clostridia bacterium]|nr:hypothetical protein [Clostridia bacterium]